eukprot:14436112-Alexandrium_andersonii.AAC.1
MSASLVGSEMCIRDRSRRGPQEGSEGALQRGAGLPSGGSAFVHSAAPIGRRPPRWALKGL